MTIRAKLSLTVEAYTWCVRRFNLGDVHPTLVGGDMWYPDRERAALNERVRSQLRELGLMEYGREELSHLGEDVFDVMQRAEVEYTTYASVRGTSVNVRAASIGSDAVLVISANGEIDIQGIEPDELGIRVARALPDTPPAYIHSTTCEESVLNALAAGKQLPPTNRIVDARRLHHFLTLKRINMGQLAVRVRRSIYDPLPLKTGAPVPVWIDTPEGRGLVHVDDAGWVNLKGAGDQDIAEHFRVMEDNLRDEPDDDALPTTLV